MDAVVVENEDSPEMWHKLQPGSADGNKNGTNMGGVTTGASGTSQPHVSDESSVRNAQFDTDGKFGSLGNWLRWRVFPIVQ